jgi:hypothetical protein
MSLTLRRPSGDVLHDWLSTTWSPGWTLGDPRADPLHDA